jgi:hypothetical protein
MSYTIIFIEVWFITASMRFKITIAIAIALAALGMRSLVSYEGDPAPADPDFIQVDVATLTPPLDFPAP